MSTRSCRLMVARCVARRPQRSGVAGNPSRSALVQKGRPRTWSRRRRPRLSQPALTLSIKFSNASLFFFFFFRSDLVVLCTRNVHRARRGRACRKLHRPTLVSRPVAGAPPIDPDHGGSIIAKIRRSCPIMPKAPRIRGKYGKAQDTVDIPRLAFIRPLVVNKR